MKNLKKIVAFVLFALTVNFVNAQKAPFVKKANKKVNQLNERIMSVDEALKLDAEQMKLITAIEIEKLKAVKKIKNSDLGEDSMQSELKNLYKTSFKKMFDEVLRKEQKVAFRNSKKE
ncbi:hypothetical protein ACFLSU_08940 [Bacteroidota bacterium]